MLSILYARCVANALSRIRLVLCNVLHSSSIGLITRMRWQMRPGQISMETDEQVT